MSHRDEPRQTAAKADIGSADVASVEALRDADRRLQQAQLGSDVAALDRLIDDRLIFTGPDGRHYTKQDDLQVHRSGRQAMTRVDEEETTVLVAGDAGVTWFLGTLEGTMDGEPFLARVRYTRTWVHDAQGWRLIAAHVSPADAGRPGPRGRTRRRPNHEGQAADPST